MALERTANLVIFACLVLIFLLALFVAMGVFVYRDAKRRNLNATLWTLVCLFVPGFVGLIIYLLVRSQESGHGCPHCGNRVAAAHRHCPYCGEMLHALCPHCGASLQPGWASCARCGQKLDEVQPATPRTEKESRSLGCLVGSLIAVPILLVILMIAGLAAFNMPVTFSIMGQSVASLATWDFDFESTLLDPSLAEEWTGEHYQKVLDWLEECKQSQESVAAYQFKDYHYDKNTHRYTFAIFLRGEDSEANMIADGNFRHESQRNRVVAELVFKEFSAAEAQAKKHAREDTEPAAYRLVWYATESDQEYPKDLELELIVNGNKVILKK